MSKKKPAVIQSLLTNTRYHKRVKKRRTADVNLDCVFVEITHVFLQWSLICKRLLQKMGALVLVV